MKYYAISQDISHIDCSLNRVQNPRVLHRTTLNWIFGMFYWTVFYINVVFIVIWFQSDWHDAESRTLFRSLNLKT